MQQKTEYRYPPDALTRHCPAPVYNGKTWGDVAQYAIEVRAALAKCNNDKAALRKLKKGAQ